MQNLKNIFLSVIIPVYNEEKVIEQVVNSHILLLNKLEPSLMNWEILCLNDASTDHSGEILQKLSLKFKNIRIITHPKNEGIQTSFMRLHQEAAGTHIYHTGGDNQWPSENLELLLNNLVTNQLDYVIGVRQNRQQIYSLWRKILSYGSNFLPLLLFGVETKDSNGIKLGKKEVFLIPLISKSFFAETERVIEAKKRGFKIGFQDIIFLARTEGKARGAKFKYVWNSSIDLFKYSLMNIYRTVCRKSCINRRSNYN